MRVETGAAFWASDGSRGQLATAAFVIVVVAQIWGLLRLSHRRSVTFGLGRWFTSRRDGRGLFRAISREEIGPYYQPISSASDGALVGFESLARWRHPSRGVLAAGTFLPHIERQGQMAALDRRMLLAVARDLPELMSRLDPARDPFVTVNLSPRRLAQPGYAREIVELLESEGLGAGGLVIEMTEASAVANWPSFIDNITHFHNAGIGLAIDDFGAGHANLTLLSQLEVDLVKLDRKVIELAMSREGSAVVRGAIATAQASGALIVAEGVEDRGWMAPLSDLGADFVQGYGIGYPMPLSELPLPRQVSTG